MSLMDKAFSNIFVMNMPNFELIFPTRKSFCRSLKKGKGGEATEQGWRGEQDRSAALASERKGKREELEK